MKHFIYTIFIAIVFIGCSKPMYQLSLNSNKLYIATKKETTGYVFGTISFPNEKRKYDTYEFYMLNNLKKSNSTIFTIPLIGLTNSHNGNYDKGRTYLFGMRVKIGDYNLCQITTSKIYPIIKKVFTINGFSIPFKVTPNTINYIGEITFKEEEYEKGNFISIKNMIERDTEGMKTLQPFIPWEKAINWALKQ
jgi:hypothetical protein